MGPSSYLMFEKMMLMATWKLWNNTYQDCFLRWERTVSSSKLTWIHEALWVSTFIFWTLQKAYQKQHWNAGCDNFLLFLHKKINKWYAPLYLIICTYKKINHVRDQNLFKDGRLCVYFLQLFFIYLFFLTVVSGLYPTNLHEAVEYTTWILSQWPYFLQFLNVC